MKNILKTERTDHGICFLDVYRAPGDLNDSWDIAPVDKDGRSLRLPNASYGPEAINRSPSHFTPVHVVETYVLWDENGYTKSLTTIFADGEIAADRSS